MYHCIITLTGTSDDKHRLKLDWHWPSVLTFYLVGHATIHYKVVVEVPPSQLTLCEEHLHHTRSITWAMPQICGALVTLLLRASDDPAAGEHACMLQTPTSCFLYLMMPPGVMMPGGSYLSERFASAT